MTTDSDSPDRITWIGASVIILTTIGLFSSMIWVIPSRKPILVAMGAGALLGIAATVAAVEQFTVIAKPFAGLLDTVVGASLLVAIMIFCSSAVQIISGVLDQFSGDSILGLVGPVLLPLAGYGITFTGGFLAAIGSMVVPWDRCNGGIRVGVGWRDVVFTSILAGMSAFGILGTAFFTDLPISKTFVSIISFVTATSSFNGTITGFLVVITYITVHHAWKALPIRELLSQAARSSYDRLAAYESFVSWVILPVCATILGAYDIGQVRGLSWVAPFVSTTGRTVLIWMLGGALGVWLLMRCIQLITSGRKTLRWLLPYVLFAGLAYLATPFLPRVVEHVVSGLPELLASAIMPMMESLGETHFVMVVLTVGAGVAAVVKGIITLLRMIGLMPTGLRGTTLVSAGLLFAVIGLHLYRPQPLLLFVGVGGAMVVWKIGKQSVVLSAETGRTSTTARVELTHLLATFLFASLSVLVARTALFIATSIQFRLDAAGWMVFVLASIGLVLVTANFRNQ